MTNWLYLDLNSFFASCEQQENPALRGKPLAIVPMKTDSTSVLAASYPAKAFGIKTGTRVGEAKRLCPELRLAVANHHTYIKYHHQVIAAVESCLPVHSVCSIDEVACELTGSHQNPARAQELALLIKKTLAEKVGVCLTASIGLAPNMYLAKVAADMQKPDGLTLIHKHELPNRLQALGLRDLPGIGSKMENRLWAQGVRDMPTLLSCNETRMRSLWGGILGARMYRLLRGESISVSHRSGQSIGHEHVLPPQQRNYQEAYSVALKLLDKATQRVRRDHQLTRRMHLRVSYISGGRFEETATFDNTCDTSKLSKILLKQWSKVSREEKPIKVSITLSDFISMDQEQLSLFENPQKAELFKCVDEINKKYGGKTLFIASLLEQQKSAPTRIAFQRIPEMDEFE